jgi:hypothetical protein
MMSRQALKDFRIMIRLQLPLTATQVIAVAVSGNAESIESYCLKFSGTFSGTVQ